ncbi:MAG: tRNA (adenosine(37)-N6)-threonylcarbamoyltransferase complex dimerization subunit type 1 TsaB [Bacteroidales bacterium]|nr:tRNA (adenosine(37)-N6)-threonylcarbamoyltransferase complex dimerization subunit type 1 TsaB [Bacteroidales bacterium]
MTRILCLETATETCSVALSNDAECIACEEVAEGHSHAEKILELADRCLKSANCDIASVDAVCISSGPGSYTGLRIGVSTAKGICYALSKPLIAVPTLEGIANGACQHVPDADIICPMIDARRMEVYCALYDMQGNPMTECTNSIIGEDSFAEELRQHRILFCGNGAAKCRPILQGANSLFSSSGASARNLISPAYRRWQERQFEDVAYFEPFYLKSYIAGKPHVKGLEM